MKWWKYIRLALKYRKVLEAVLSIPMEVRAARDPASPGGASFTNDELAAIGAKVMDALSAADSRFVQ